MRHRLAGSLLPAVALFFAATLYAGFAYCETLHFVVDGQHAFVGVKVWHFGVSHMRAEFRDVSGTITLDPEKPAGAVAEITIDAESLTSGAVGRVDAVKSDQFLDVEKYPKITFRSRSVEKKGDRFEITGDITIKGTTRKITFPVSIAGPRKDPFGGVRLGIEGEFVLDRQDFGVSFDRAMEDGEPMVGNEVFVEFAIEAVLTDE